MNAYEILKEHFAPAGLTIDKREWCIKKDGAFSFHGTIASLAGNAPTRINSASYEQFNATASSPDEVVSQLFEMAKAEKMWLGGYGDYHSVIEWNAAENRFVTREMTNEERFKQNCLY